MASTTKKVQTPSQVRGATRPTKPGEKRSLVREQARKNDALVSRVRALAQKQQRQTPQVFLSVREAARSFKVSVAAMAEVYRRLTQDGLLATVRGSHTMLRGRTAARTLKVQGMVGIPVSTRRFLTLRDYRDCFQHLRDELFARGFASRCVFFDRDADPEFLVSRFTKADVDTVIWILPDGSGRDTVMRLRDRGIRFVGVSFAAAAGVFCRYEVRRREAIGTIFRHWRQDARVRKATIIRVRGEVGPDGERMERIESLATAEEIHCEIATLPKGDLPQAVSALCARAESAIVIPSSAAAVLAWREPDAVTAVLEGCRVALIDGPIDVPASQNGGQAAADVVTIDWGPIARRIASDVATGEAAVDDEPMIFEAQAMLRVPLRTLMRV